MGSDLYMNPPRDQCKKCKAWVEWRRPNKLCLECYEKGLRADLKKLKRENAKLRKVVRLSWVGSDKEFDKEFPS